MNSTMETAGALLDLTTKVRERVSRHVDGYQRVQAQLGDSVASWAYADKGIGPGLRAPCASAGLLAKWRPDEGDWCRVIIGVQGTGKSVAAARYVADRGGLLVSATSADGWGYGGGLDLARARDARWLLIDDFGETKTKPGIGNIGTLIVDRYAARARCFTVITTALSQADIQERYGDNVMDRLRPHMYGPFARETKSRRATAAPVLTGFHRESEIAWYARQVEHAAHGVLHDKAAINEAITRFAELTGIDLEGETIATTIAAEKQRREEMEREGAEFIALMDVKRQEAALRLVPPRREDHDELLAWIDGVGEVDG
jgi:hypothetical protein